MLTVTEVIEDGIPYRITEDLETGLYLKESLLAPLPPGPNRLTILEQENESLKAQLSQTNSDLAALMEAVYLAP